MRGRFGRIAIGVLSVGVVMVLAASLTVSAGPGLLSWVDERVDRAAEPTGAKQAPPETAEKTEKAKKAPEDKKAEKEEDEARKKLDDKEQKKVAKAESVPKEPEEKLVAPADTTMSLDVPAIGLNDVMVYEGTGESSLYYGTGHLSGTGYPWVEESNTYIAGHRVGYPGTGSDYVFWDLPALGVGDSVYLTDANGQTYEYAVSEILEVPITDLSVTAPVAGRDVVSLQTCIENYGDYWTEGPNWFVRYVVRADKVEA
jgi:sortase A